MSRLTLGNVVKVALTVFFLPLLAYLVLLIGSVKKKLWVGLEGTIYAAGFSAAIFVLDFSGLSVLLGLASMGASGVRAYHLRDLWLPQRRRRWWRPAPAEFRSHVSVPPRPGNEVGPADDLPAALGWVAAHAKQNKRRLPGEAYVSLLETCQVLDSVIDAERRQPSGDARLEYELDAVVREYLPEVLQGYLALPPSMVGTRQPNGRTPDEELVEQLQLLSGQAEALGVSRHSRTTAELTTTGNFLREKFGHRRHGAVDLGIE